MKWFLFALASLFGWGCADLFYKKGTDSTDRLSHLKIAVWVGLVMGVCSFSDAFSVLELIGSALIVCGVIALAVVEKMLDSKTVKDTSAASSPAAALALIFPLLYCVFDTLGTAADGIILDEETGLGLSEADVLIIYGLTFFLAGLISWIIILIKEKRPYDPFAKTELPKMIAALCEEATRYFMSSQWLPARSLPRP